MTELAQQRAEKDAFFRHHAHSPLTPAQQRAFTGLSYFPEAAGLRLVLAVEPLDGAVVDVPTSTGDVQRYARWGRVRFEVDGQRAALTIYRAPHGLFLPFADALAGVETYGAGRYLEPEELRSGEVLVDFNLAYNPYCAYNDRWSCPLTPAENRIDVPIRAGERVFGDH